MATSPASTTKLGGSAKPATPPKPRGATATTCLAWRSPPAQSVVQQRMCGVIKPQISRKPALLPKPTVTPPPRRYPTHKNSAAAVPPSLKAPVAKLEEFFDPPSNATPPVRPPRSPKNKTFTNGPFGEKPPIPAKKKALATPSEAPTGTITPVNLVARKIKSASLGRVGLVTFQDAACQETNTKSCSLSRDISWTPNLGGPVRPPRRPRRRVDPLTGELVIGHPLDRSISLFSALEETEQDVPIYAVVNYALKKNRREAAAAENSIQTTAEYISGDTSDLSQQPPASCAVVSQAAASVLLLSLQTNAATAPLEHNAFAVSEQKIELPKKAVSTMTQPSDSNDVISIEVDKKKATTDDTAAHLLASLVDHEKVLTTELLSSCQEEKHPEKWSSVEALEDFSELGYASAKTSLSSSCSELLPTETAATKESATCAEKAEAAASVGMEEAQNALSKDIHVASGASGSQRSNDGDSSSTVKSNGSFGSGKLILSPVRQTLQSGRRLERHWCDEGGDLSTGVLGDVDSSDTARQSSVERDEVGGSDEENTSVRRTFRTLTNLTKNILRKSGRKSKEANKKGDLQSQFYCEHPVDTSETEERELPPPPESPAENESAAPHCPVVVAHPPDESEAEEEQQIDHVSSEQKQAKKAFQIAEEIMTSERVFVDVLKLLSVDFRSFVEATSRDHKHPVINESDLSKVLLHLPEILKLNEDLLHDMEERILAWGTLGKIADVIVKKGPFLKLYTSYIQNFANQGNYLDECCLKWPNFSKAVQAFEASPRCQKLSIKHYMLKPIQRVPQYRLLLENYLRCLDTSSPDFQDTQTALQIVCDVAEHANRSLKEGDALSKLLKLQSLLGHYEIIKPGRLLLREGELLKMCRKGMQPRYFILLNDCLLYTSYYGSGLSNGLKVNYELPLHQMKVHVSSAEDYANEFSIISVRRSFTLCASSAQEMHEWFNTLQAAIQDKTNKESTFHHARLNQGDSSLRGQLGKEAPVWIPDARVTMCQICTTEFTVTFRRHHCRACGKVVCHNCSANKALLQYMKYQVARACDDCFAVFHKEFHDGHFKPENLQTEQETSAVLENAKLVYKKAPPTSNIRRSKKYIPKRLKEVCANDTACQMNGWLQRHSGGGRSSWKKMWFVLKDQVLYVYKASEDVVALESLPVLGYKVETLAPNHSQLYEGQDSRLVFMLTHKGRLEHTFLADNHQLAQRWTRAMEEATTLTV